MPHLEEHNRNLSDQFYKLCVNLILIFLSTNNIFELWQVLPILRVLYKLSFPTYQTTMWITVDSFMSIMRRILFSFFFFFPFFAILPPVTNKQLPVVLAVLK